MEFAVYLGGDTALQSASSIALADGPCGWAVEGLTGSLAALTGRPGPRPGDEAPNARCSSGLLNPVRALWGLAGV